MSAIRSLSDIARIAKTDANDPELSSCPHQILSKFPCRPSPSLKRLAPATPSAINASRPLYHSESALRARCAHDSSARNVDRHAHRPAGSARSLGPTPPPYRERLPLQ